MEMSGSIVSRDHILEIACKEQEQFGWRYGQALYNTTYIFYPEFCDARTATEDDPFYAENELDFRIQKWHFELKRYIENLLELKEAEAANKP